MGVIYGWNWKLPNGRVNPDALPKAQHSSKSQVLNRRKTKRTRKTRKPTNWVEFPGIGYVNLASSNQAQINNQIELGRSLAVGTFPQLYRVDNNAKVIRSSSLPSSIRSGDYNLLTNETKNSSLQNIPTYLCSDNSTGLCSQNEPPESPIDIPYIFDQGSQSLRQSGIQLRFRSLGDSPLWDSIYVPQSVLTNNIIILSDISNNPINIYTINLEQVLPNGTYQIEYDIIVDSNAADVFVIRITDTVNIENSQQVLFDITLEEAPKLLPFTGNINDPTYNINYSNTEEFNNFIDNIVNETYNISATQNTSGDGNTEITIPKTLGLVNPTTNIEYYENYNVLISMITKYEDITYFGLTITSQIPRNNSYVAFTREYTFDEQEPNLGGWLAPSFFAALNQQ